MQNKLRNKENKLIYKNFIIKDKYYIYLLILRIKRF